DLGKAVLDGAIVLPASVRWYARGNEEQVVNDVRPVERDAHSCQSPSDRPYQISRLPNGRLGVVRGRPCIVGTLRRREEQPASLSTFHLGNGGSMLRSCQPRPEVVAGAHELLIDLR